MNESARKEVVIKWYQEMYSLLWSLAWQYTNRERIAMAPDDIFAELSLELVKVVHRYCEEKEGEEMRRLLIVSMRNRCLDLVKTEYYTHRKARQYMMSLDDENDDGSPAYEWLHEAATQFDYFDLSGLLEALSVDGRMLVNEVLNPDDSLALQMDMAIARKVHVSIKNCWKVSLTPLMLRRALGWDMDRFDHAWKEVQTVLYAVCN